MKNKYEFDRFVSKMGLDDAEMSLAELVWSKAEESFDTKGKTKVAALLGGFNGVSSNDLRVKPKVTSGTKLTQSELQFLRSYISGEIAFSESREVSLKKLSSTWWSLCDRNDKKTLNNFNAFSATRKEYNRVNTQRKKLAAIQRKIRKMLDSGVV